MKTLSETWFADGYIDFELKKYTLLAYLQEVNRYFDENKLYPQLSDMVFHYNNLLNFKIKKEVLQQHFPKKLTALDVQRLQLLYQSMAEDDELMKELEEIIHFALGKIKLTVEEGREIYEFVEEKLDITPVGIIPLDCREGYFFLRNGKRTDTWVYQYRISMFEKDDEKYRSMQSSYIANWKYNYVNTSENIKSELVRNRSDLPNPAVYAIESDLSFPVEETLLPVARRRLVRYIMEAS